MLPFRSSLLFLACLLCVTSASAQFFLNGSAVATNDSCFQLTPAENWQVGSIWNGELIDLNQSFEVIADVFLGCEDTEGADGMVFGLQPVSTSIGQAGGGIGFENVMPSLGVEFDTYLNADFGDPEFDHLAIIRDGILNHNVLQGSLAGPVQANATAVNVEDCQYHSMRITWDAVEQIFSVYFDCELRLAYEADIVNEIFNGESMVFWGFTSATGGLNNAHEVCFSYTTFLDELVDQTICPGESVPLQVSGGTAYSWSPAAGLSDTTSSNPVATPTETTLYTVEILDNCGEPFYDDVLITVDNDQFEVTAELLPDNPSTVPPGVELTLSATINPDSANYSYAWMSDAGSTIVQPDSATTPVIIAAVQDVMETFTLVVTSEDGCIQEVTIPINIEGGLFAVPNIFSPNGDSVNDQFGVFTQAVLENYYCKIYNRWGQTVFESNSPTEFWDGTFNSKNAPSDEYLYQLSFAIGSLNFEQSGSLTLLR